MSLSVDQITEEALNLPPADRAELVEKLRLSLGSTVVDFQDEWISEAKARLKAYRAGELPAISAEESMARLGHIVD